MDIDVLKKTLTVQFRGVIFLIMALVGGIMALLPAALSPFFHAQFWPALVLLICALVFLLWRGAGKSAKMGLAIVALVMGLWLLINAAWQISLPPLPELDLSAVLAGDITALAPFIKLPATLSLGGVGGFIALVGAIFGIFAAKE